jgi:hypothetical protein
MALEFRHQFILQLLFQLFGMGHFGTLHTTGLCPQHGQM